MATIIEFRSRPATQVREERREVGAAGTAAAEIVIFPRMGVAWLRRLSEAMRSDGIQDQMEPGGTA